MIDELRNNLLMGILLVLVVILAVSIVGIILADDDEPRVPQMGDYLDSAADLLCREAGHQRGERRGDWAFCYGGISDAISLHGVCKLHPYDWCGALPVDPPEVTHDNT